jgi:hypothetical protein
VKQQPPPDDGKYPHGCWPGLDVPAGRCGGVVGVGVGFEDGDCDGDREGAGE